MKRLVKKIMRSDAAHAVVCWIIAQYIRLVYYTSRWEHEGIEARDALIAEGKPFVIVLWHNRIAMMPYAWRPKKWPLTILASGHRDGQIVIRTMAHFNIKSIAGSSQRGGAAATKSILREMKAGSFIGITPDGPRGPRMRMKDGPVAIARLGKARITMVTFSVKRRILLNSWDRFCLPLPFNKGIFMWDTGFELPGKVDKEGAEAFRQHLEQALTDFTDEADRRMGHAPIPPAPEDKDNPSDKEAA